METSFLQSYCYTKFGNFFVSTIHRRSSATTNEEMWFYETFGWELLDDKKTRGKWIADNSGALSGNGALIQHNEVVRQLYEKGEFRLSEN